MDTRMLTNQVRMAKWSEIIKDRCESGLTIKEYCAERGISRDAYFYWLKKIRESAVACKCQFNFVQKVENNFVQFSALRRLVFKECALVLQPV